MKHRMILKKATGLTGAEITERINRLRKTTKVFHLTMTIPILLFALVLVASLERVPLTGRYVQLPIAPG